ncbi:MAG: radical SAM protein, partial [Verrucomicrobiota bacterium]
MSQVVPLIEGRELVPVSETIKNVYVHVPFCTHICPYCAFYKTKNLTRDMKPFLPALQNELEWARSVLPIVPETIFFGGGTPSALSIHQLNQWATFWPWQEVPEYTMEANPMTISEKKAQYLLELG